MPDLVQARYGFEPQMPVRLIETQRGVLLIPLTPAPMDTALRAELAEWQALGTESIALFPFDEEAR